MTTLITGGTGFVGRHLLARLTRDGDRQIRVLVRGGGALPAPIDTVEGDVTVDGDWERRLKDVTAIVHLAARVHVMRDDSRDPLAEFRRVNVQSTRALAARAASAGVRRFVYLSSVKVHGESGRFTETDPLRPADPYAVSKCEAEAELARIAASTGMEVVVVRPPLVYGRGVGANFAALLRAVERGVPLPLAAVANVRSLIAVDNLVDFIVRCHDDPAAANETFLVSDDEDLSTPELIRRLSRAVGRPARLLSVPVPVLVAAAALTGRRAELHRVVDSLSVDISRARQRLGWRPPLTVDAALQRMLRP